MGKMVNRARDVAKLILHGCVDHVKLKSDGYQHFVRNEKLADAIVDLIEDVKGYMSRLLKINLRIPRDTTVDQPIDDNNDENDMDNDGEVDEMIARSIFNSCARNSYTAITFALSSLKNVKLPSYHKIVKRSIPPIEGFT